MKQSPDGRPSDALRSLDRRGFLRGTAGGTLALALGSVLPAARTVAASPAGAAPLALSPGELATARAAAEALLAGVPVDPDWVARELDREVSLIGEPVRSDMKAVLRLIENLTFLEGRLGRFTSLDREARLDVLLGWGRSRFNLRRAAFHGVRTLIHFVAWARPETRPITGYEGTWPQRDVPIPPYPVDFGEVR